jgi:hypothetical protein
MIYTHFSNQALKNMDLYYEKRHFPQNSAWQLCTPYHRIEEGHQWLVKLSGKSPIFSWHSNSWGPHQWLVAGSKVGATLPLHHLFFSHLLFSVLGDIIASQGLYALIALFWKYFFLKKFNIFLSFLHSWKSLRFKL